MIELDHEALVRAEDLASLHGEPVRPWMLWEGWWGHVGCENCAEGGPLASCWGRADCHGYYNGCGCGECTVRDRTESPPERRLWED